MSNKEWTIMIYMAGDNNLSVDMAYTLEQIKSVASEGDDSPNLFVYYDGNSPDIPTLYCDFSEPQKPRYVRSFMVPDKLYRVPQKPNENTADIKSVYNFVDWCLNKVQVENNGEISYGRRSQKYALIFSGHSLGFQDKGLFRDEGSDKSMKMIDLYVGVRRLTDSQKTLKNLVKDIKFDADELKRETTVLIGQQLDILGFDSCVMGMLEVGYQFNDVAKTMIASEGSVPNAGWTYAKILGNLTQKNDNNSNEKIVRNFVRDFIHSQDSYTIGGVSVDMAAWDLSRFHSLATAFDALATELIYCFDDEKSIIYRQMERVILQVHWKCQSYMYDQNVDLGDFCELLDYECQRIAEELDYEDVTANLNIVRGKCAKVLEELRNAVILSGFSGGSYQYSNGVSIFFPWSREGFEVSKKNYKNLWISKEAFNKKYPWTMFLDKYLNEVALRKSEPPTPLNAPVGSKYRYFSGIKFDEESSFLSSHNVMTKIAGQEGSKIAGQEGSKIAGQEGSKIAGQEGSKLANNNSSDAFFGSLRMFKNTETRWNISGFTKRPEESQVKS
jgi:hypothetical protein